MKQISRSLQKQFVLSNKNYAASLNHLIPIRQFHPCLHDETKTYIVREPLHPVPGKYPEEISADKCLSDLLASGMRVFVMSAAGTPVKLASALADTAKEKQVSDVEVIHIHTEGPAKYAQEEYSDHIRVNSLFTGANLREAVAAGRADYTPIFLSEVPYLFRRGYKPLDIALVQVSPPDKHGFCTMGVSVDISRAAVQCARYVIAQINPSMPRTFGDGIVHISNFDRVVYHSEPLPELRPKPLNKKMKKIGELVAHNLVRDGATLQMGIGAIPDAVLAALKNHTDLGVHSEMFSDGIIDLVECGAITNKFKPIHQGKIVGGFCFGTHRLYDFIDNNPSVLMMDIAHVNDARVIEEQFQMTAINSAIEVDLTGQVVSDSIGNTIYSGVGGQLDFIRGAGRALNGVPILALPSTTSSGHSRIVPYIAHGGGVVTTRAHVHYVVTEFGIANLFGKSLREKAEALISIAHPDHQEELQKMAFERIHNHLN